MSTRPKVIATGLVLLVLAAGFAGWRLGHSTKSTSNDGSTNSAQSSTANKVANATVKSLISYTLPDGWSEGTCSNSSNIYITPKGSSLNCGSNPSAPIRIYVDTQNTTDCQQLMPSTTQGIRKHVCISLYINGHKSLKASTEYSDGSGYKVDTTISDYFIDTGNDVAAIEYTYTSSNDFQAGFDQLATSVKVR